MNTARKSARNRMPLTLASSGCNQLLTSVADLPLPAHSLQTVFLTSCTKHIYMWQSINAQFSSIYVLGYNFNLFLIIKYKCEDNWFPKSILQTLSKCSTFDFLKEQK